MELLEFQMVSPPFKWSLSSPPPFLFFPSNSNNPLKQPAAFSLSHNPAIPVFLFRRFSIANPATLRHSRWDSSNAKSSRSKRFSFNSRYDDGDDEDEEHGFRTKRKKKKKRRWWSGDSSKFNEEEEEDDEVDKKGPVGVLEEAIDGLLILKVFGSYGWTLPVILLSLLLATGPKAFFITLSLFSGFSVLALAIEKLWPGLGSNSKKKSRRRKRRSRYSTTAFRMEEEQDERRESRSTKIGYESWVSQVDFSAQNPQEDSNSLGGWDELEGGQFVGRSRQFSERSRRIQMDNGRNSRKASRDDAPLLMRVLIALFPFLSSWTKWFW